MSSREELGNALLECLRDVASLLEHAHAVALQEQDALVANDAEAIALSCASQDEVLRRVVEADQRAAAVAEQLAEAAGLDLDSGDHVAIAEAAALPCADLIAGELARISDAAQKVQDANKANAALLENGLDIVTSCLRAVACEADPVTYSKDASHSTVDGSILSLDSIV